MAIDIKNFVLNKLTEYNDGSGYQLDTRPGSILHDLLVAPLADVLAPYQADHQTFIDKLSLVNPSEMSEAEVDAVGNRFLITRVTGSKSSGSVYIYFNAAKSIIIPKGTSFFTTDTNLEFISTDTFNVSKSQMLNNTDFFPYYVAGPIVLKAAIEDVIYNIEASTLFKTTSNIFGTPIKITNLQKFSTGKTKETNAEFYDRIKRELYGKNLGSTYAMDGFVSDIIPEAVSTTIIGAGSPLMTRDLSYTITSVEQEYIDNFLYVYSGLHDIALNNKGHIAYVDVFADFNPTSGLSLPGLASFVSEFSNEDYAAVSKLTDTKNLVTSDLAVLSDFNYTAPSDKTLQILLLSGTWSLGDGVNYDGTLSSNEEIGFSGNKLRLGKTASLVSNSRNNVKVSIDQINTMIAKLDTEGRDSVADVSALLADLASAENINNFSPVIQKPIQQSTAIDITLTMSTTDTTDLGEMAYITTARRDGIYAPHDGFGVAWRKQPDFLTRLDENDYAQPSIKTADEQTFLDYFNVSFSTISGQLSDPSNKSYWFYNYYIVDNDVLDDNVWIGNDQIVDQSTGRNQFLVAAKVWIKTGTEYLFKLTITEGLGVKGYVDGTQVANLGVRYPGYKLMGDYDVVQSDITNRTLRGSIFGIGVGHTHNAEWYVSDLKIVRNTESFPMHMFKFYVNDFPNLLTEGLNYEYYGIGYDANRSISPTYSGASNSYVKLAAFNFDTDDWEILGSHTVAAPYSGTVDLNDIPNYGISGELPPNGIGSVSSYIDGQGYINFLACPYNTGPNFPGNTNHTLKTFYIEINNGSSTGVHRGNCVDIYVQDPKNIQEETVSLGLLSGNKIILKNNPAVSRYIQDIVDVYISDSLSGAVVSTFDESEYSIINNNAGTTFSSESDYTIIFNDQDLSGANISIKYRYWSNGVNLNSELNNSEYRFPTVSYAAKTMPAANLVINNLEYSGKPTVDEVKTAIRDYINLTPDLLVFDKFALVSLLTDLGVTYINISNITATIREYSPVFRKTDFELTSDIQTYTLQSSLSKFYTSLNDLAGVRKV